jgi:hypothetical protein
MPRGGWPEEAAADIAARRDALRQAASLPGADPRTLIDAALTELDAAIEAISAGTPGAAAGAGDPSGEALPEAVRTERRLLQAVFQQAPVPLFLLEQDGTIRRTTGPRHCSGRRRGTRRASRLPRSSTCPSGPPSRRCSPP